MRTFVGLLLTLTISLVAQAGNVGDWKLYLAYHKAVSSQPVGDEIYANFDGNLLVYHPEDNEVRQISKLNGLNGRNIIEMGYSESEKCLVLIYDDFQIDLLYPGDGGIVSLPQIKNAGIDDLKFNHLYVRNEDAILAVSNGVIQINLKNQEITGYYKLNKDVKAAALFNGVLYAGTPGLLLACSTEGNPLDNNEWKSIQNSAFCRFTANGNHLYGVTNQNINNGLTTGLWIMGEDGKTFHRITDAVYPSLFSRNGKLLVMSPLQFMFFNDEQPETPEKIIKNNNAWFHLSYSSDGTIWASNGYSGLQPYVVDKDSVKEKGEAIGNYGPRRDLCYYMKYDGDQLLIAGGRLDPYDRIHYPATLMRYENNKWEYFQEQFVSENPRVRYRDITSVVRDPKNPKHYFATSSSSGVYEYDDLKIIRHYSDHNSPLVSVLDSKYPDHVNYVRMDGLTYDEAGNLWMVNNSADTVLHAILPDGTWKGVYAKGIAFAPTCEKTLIDQKGRLWVASRRSVSKPNHDAGLLCLDYNKTVSNEKDDVSTYRSTFVNQDGRSYLLKGVYCMVEDKDGSIWVGTKAGLFVITHPEDWHKADFRVTQIKVPRNDGTNLADYLLSEIPISAIAIDGAGRKWIGTESNGLYMVSADGTKILNHFESSNTPLLSNYIYSIAPNLKTGEIMIGTDKGLCSYQSAATSSETSLNKNNIKVFPNPVRPEYNGTVKVTGLTENAEIKVVTTNGEVVGSGISTGGTFVWDVRGRDGARVAPGIYYFMISTADGNKGIAAKIAVI